MKKKLANNIAFFTLLITIIAVLGHIMTPKFMVKYNLANTKNGVYTMLKVEDKNSLDMLVIGDSESYTTVSPLQLWEKYGITSFVAGQTAAKLSESRDILEVALETQSPKVVLLETNSLFKADKEDDSLQAQIAETLSEYCPLIKNHDCWKSPFHGVHNNFKGYWINSDVEPCNAGDYMAPTDQREAICEQNRQIVEEINKMCQNKGAQLVLYSAPSPVNYNYAKHNGISDLAESLGISYVDLNLENDKMQIDWATDTRDAGDHLNSAGGVKTTDFIGQYLQEHFQLKDHQNMKVAKSWNKLLKEYNARSEKAIQRIKSI